MRFRNEIAPTIGGSYGATTNSKCLGGHTNNAPLGTDLETRIKVLGQSLEVAYAHGDRATAQRYQRAMYRAIAQRVPAKQDERFREIDAAICESAS